MCLRVLWNRFWTEQSSEESLCCSVAFFVDVLCDRVLLFFYIVCGLDLLFLSHDGKGLMFAIVIDVTEVNKCC